MQIAHIFFFFFDYHYWNVNRKKYSMCAAEEEEKEKKWRNLAALALAQQFSIQENKRSEKDKLSNGEKREQNFFLQRECVYITRSIGWHTKWVIQFVLLERLQHPVCAHITEQI